MQTIITKACNELGIKPVPSKRVCDSPFALSSQVLHLIHNDINLSLLEFLALYFISNAYCHIGEGWRTGDTEFWMDGLCSALVMTFICNYRWNLCSHLGEFYGQACSLGNEKYTSIAPPITTLPNYLARSYATVCHLLLKIQ